MTSANEGSGAVWALVLPLRIAMPLEADTARDARVVQLVVGHGVEAHRATVPSGPSGRPPVSSGQRSTIRNGV